MIQWKMFDHAWLARSRMSFHWLNILKNMEYVLTIVSSDAMLIFSSNYTNNLTILFFESCFVFRIKCQSYSLANGAEASCTCWTNIVCSCGQKKSFKKQNSVQQVWSDFPTRAKAKIWREQFMTLISLILTAVRKHKHRGI